MKRFLSVLVGLSLCVAVAGCPGGEEGDEAAVDGVVTTDGGTAADGSVPAGQFREGVDSGRAEDGSDEAK